MAFAKAWFKLTHRDMGQRIRYLGDEIPAEQLIWQDPIPTIEAKLVSGRNINKIKTAVLDSGLSVPALDRTAWASAFSFRTSDMHSGANGGHIVLAPQKEWENNKPRELALINAKISEIQRAFNDANSTKLSLADVIVLDDAAAIGVAAKQSGATVKVPFVPGRGDATQGQTNMLSFDLLEPSADAFRNYFNPDRSYRSPTEMLVDRADQLALTVPEMTALIGGKRVLCGNYDGDRRGVLTDKPGILSNDFLVNLVYMSTQ